MMAARHASQCLWVAGLSRSHHAGPPLAAHVAVRLELIRHCLALPF